MLLKTLCDQAIARFPPLVDAATGRTLYTYCNAAVDFVCGGMGCDCFRGPRGPLTADAICRILERGWVAVDGAQAAELARGGTLCVAALDSASIRLSPKHAQAAHGHVAAVYPAEKGAWSPSWKKTVPLLANAGARNGVLPASQCFPAEPKYYFRPGGPYAP